MSILHWEYTSKVSFSSFEVTNDGNSVGESWDYKCYERNFSFVAMWETSILEGDTDWCSRMKVMMRTAEQCDGCRCLCNE